VAATYSLLWLLCPILLFLAGLIPLVRRFGSVALQGDIDRLLGRLPSHSSTVWHAALIVLPLCLLVLYIARLFRVQVLVLKTETATPLRIRESAVSSYIRDRLLTLPFIRNALVGARSRGGALALHVRVWVVCRKPLSNMQEQVTGRIVEDARNSFGVSRILPPDVQFESVRVSKTGIEQEEEAEAPARDLPGPAEPFEETGAKGEKDSRTETSSASGGSWGN
jgi:hypothetical protein